MWEDLFGKKSLPAHCATASISESPKDTDFRFSSKCSDTVEIRPTASPNTFTTTYLIQNMKIQLMDTAVEGHWYIVVVIVKVGIQSKSKMIHLTQAPPPRCCSIECRQCDIAIGKGKLCLYYFEINNLPLVNPFNVLRRRYVQDKWVLGIGL